MQDLRWVDIFRRSIYNVTEFNPYPPAVHGPAAYNGMTRTYLRGAMADSDMCRARPDRADRHISAGGQRWAEPGGQQPELRHMRMDWPEVFAMWRGLWYNVFVRNTERPTAPPAGGREDRLLGFRGGLKKVSGKEWKR